MKSNCCISRNGLSNGCRNSISRYGPSIKYPYVRSCIDFSLMASSDDLVLVGIIPIENRASFNRTVLLRGVSVHDTLLPETILTTSSNRLRVTRMRTVPSRQATSGNVAVIRSRSIENARGIVTHPSSVGIICLPFQAFTSEIDLRP